MLLGHDGRVPTKRLFVIRQRPQVIFWNGLSLLINLMFLLGSQTERTKYKMISKRSQRGLGNPTSAPRRAPASKRMILNPNVIHG